MSYVTFLWFFVRQLPEQQKAAPEFSGTACKTYLSGMWKLLDQALFLELLIHSRLGLLQILERT